MNASETVLFEQVVDERSPPSAVECGSPVYDRLDRCPGERAGEART
jgi:hypothetical protein